VIRSLRNTDNTSASLKDCLLASFVRYRIKAATVCKAV